MSRGIPGLSTPENDRPPTFLQTLWSTLAAFFGVQSSANRKRDFSRGKATHFIAMGVLVTLAFILVVLGAVQLALRYAAG